MNLDYSTDTTSYRKREEKEAFRLFCKGNLKNSVDKPQDHTHFYRNLLSYLNHLGSINNSGGEKQKEDINNSRGERQREDINKMKADILLGKIFDTHEDIQIECIMKFCHNPHQFLRDYLLTKCCGLSRCINKEIIGERLVQIFNIPSHEVYTVCHLLSQID